ncbi:MAG TPA: ATP-binding protein [Actinomycetota bacterium]
MAERFIGRREQLRKLSSELKEIRSNGRGRFVLLRGRRRVGKSRLVEEFLSREGAPHAFFAATKGRPPDRDLEAFADVVAASDLRAAELLREGARFDTWEAALRLIAGSSDRRAPSVIVIDELPYLIEGDATVEGALQTGWDRAIRDSPVLLIVVGSDLAMMKALTEYDRPLYDRPTATIHLAPLSPAEIASLLDVGAAEALDAYLVIGGLPLLALSWGASSSLRSFLRRQLIDPTSPLIVSGERTVAAEFPPDAHARLVMSAIGGGERTFTAIGNASGVARQSLERALDLLVAKKVIERAVPLSSRPSRLTRYSIADPYLRFWLRFIEPSLNEIERGRGEMVVERILASWKGFRGRAIEPLAREAVSRLLPDARFGEALHAGAYWTRDGAVEVDLVGADRAAPPASVSFVGSVKWRERAPFGHRDLASLAAIMSRVPGAGTDALFVGVSRAGFDTDDLSVGLGPDELLAAWERP